MLCNKKVDYFFGSIIVCHKLLYIVFLFRSSLSSSAKSTGTHSTEPFNCVPDVKRLLDRH